VLERAGVEKVKFVRIMLGKPGPEANMFARTY